MSSGAGYDPRRVDLDRKADRARKGQALISAAWWRDQGDEGLPPAPVLDVGCAYLLLLPRAAEGAALALLKVTLSDTRETKAAAGALAGQEGNIGLAVDLVARLAHEANRPVPWPARGLRFMIVWPDGARFADEIKENSLGASLVVALASLLLGRRPRADVASTGALAVTSAGMASGALAPVAWSAKLEALRAAWPDITTFLVPPDEVPDATGGGCRLVRAGDVATLLEQHGLGELVAAPANPWRGLQRYELDDHARFVGRRREVDKACERLGAPFSETPVGGPTLLAIYGPSGMGKSSFARAGVLGGVSAGEVELIDVDLGRVAEVAGAVKAATGLVLQQVRAEALLERAGSRRLVVLVDGFERAAADADAKALAALLRDLVRARTAVGALPPAVIVTSRASTQLTAYEALRDVPIAWLQLAPLADDALREVVCPFQAPDLHVEPGFVERVAALRLADSSAWLSAVLTATWELSPSEGAMQRLTVARLDEVLRRGVWDDLGARAFDDARAAFPTRQGDAEEALWLVFALLLHKTPDGALMARSQRYDDLGPRLGLTSEELSRALKPLVGRLLVEPDPATVRVIHDTLIDNWPSLRARVLGAGGLLRSIELLELLRVQTGLWTDDRSPLDEAERLLREGRLPVSPKERTFLRDSRARRWVRRVAWIGGVALAGLAVWFWATRRTEQRDRAHEAVAARLRQAVALADAGTMSGDSRAVVLGLSAWLDLQRPAFRSDARSDEPLILRSLSLLASTAADRLPRHVIVPRDAAGRVVSVDSILDESATWVLAGAHVDGVVGALFVALDSGETRFLPTRAPVASGQLAAHAALAAMRLEENDTLFLVDPTPPQPAVRSLAGAFGKVALGATGRCFAARRREDGAVVVFDLESWRPTHELHGVYRWALAPSCSSIAAADATTSQVRVRSLDDPAGQRDRLIDLPAVDWVLHLGFSPGGALLLVDTDPAALRSRRLAAQDLVESDRSGSRDLRAASHRVRVYEASSGALREEAVGCAVPSWLGGPFLGDDGSYLHTCDRDALDQRWARLRFGHRGPKVSEPTYLPSQVTQRGWVRAQVTEAGAVLLEQSPPHYEERSRLLALWQPQNASLHWATRHWAGPQNPLRVPSEIRAGAHHGALGVASPQPAAPSWYVPRTRLGGWVLPAWEGRECTLAQQGGGTLEISSSGGAHAAIDVQVAVPGAPEFAEVHVAPGGRAVALVYLSPRHLRAWSRRPTGGYGPIDIDEQGAPFQVDFSADGTSLRYRVGGSACVRRVSTVTGFRLPDICLAEGSQPSPLVHDFRRTPEDGLVMMGTLGSLVAFSAEGAEIARRPIATSCGAVTAFAGSARKLVVTTSGKCVGLLAFGSEERLRPVRDDARFLPPATRDVARKDLLHLDLRETGDSGVAVALRKDGTLHTWRWTGGEIAARDLVVGSGPTAGALSPDGALVGVAFETGRLIVYRTTDGEPVFETLVDGVTDVRFGPTSDMVLATSSAAFSLFPLAPARYLRALCGALPAARRDATVTDEETAAAEQACAQVEREATR